MELREQAFAAIAALAIALAPCHRADAQDSVTLTFAWPENLRAEVTMSARKQRSGAGANTAPGLDMTYTMSTARIDDGLLVSFADVIARPATGEQSGTVSTMTQEFISKLSSNLPSYVIAKDGSFLRINDLSEYQARVKAALQELIDNASAEAQSALKKSGVLNDQAMAAQIINTTTEEWNLSVGAWLDATFEQGATYEAETIGNSPMLANMPIPIKTQYEFVGWTACNEGDPGRSCVELTLQSFPDPEKAGAAIESFIDQFAKQRGQDVAMQSMDQTTEVRLITEPSTLLPHRVHKIKSTSMVIAVDGKQESLGQREEVTYQFRYQH